MTLETFFKKFELFTAAPDAVAKMRELILTLAVKGKLVEQNPDDQPASMLLEEIEAKMVQGVSERKTKNPISTFFQPFSKESEPFPSPPGWAWVKLGAVAEIERGGSPRPIKDYITDDPDGLNWIKIGDTEKGGRYITSTHEKIRKEGLKKTRMVYPGDFLLTNSMSFGRPYITKIEGCIHDGWLRIHPPKQITPDYLYHLLSSSFVFALFSKSAAGAVVQNLNADKVRELPIPLPPLAEQKRIVAKVDELMALCDRLEAQQQERKSRHAELARASLARFAEAPTPANLNLLFHKSYPIPPADLRKSILTLAVQGHISSRTTRTEFQQVRLDSLGSWAQGCGFPKAEQGHTDRPILFAKVSDMNLPGNEREILKTNHTVDEAGAKRMRLKIHPSGTVVFPKIGGAIATNKRRVLVRPTAIDNNCSGIIPNETCSSDWIFLVLRSIDMAEHQSGTSVPAVNQKALGKIKVSLPPLAEQRRIVAKVDQLMALVDQLETQLTTSRSTAQNLLQALVAELTTAA